jgi:hypothetical protein
VRAKALVEEAAANPLLLIPQLALHGALQVVYSCCLPGVRVSVSAQVALLVRFVSPLALEEVLPARSGLLLPFQPEDSLKQPPPQLLQGFLQFLEQ